MLKRIRTLTFRSKNCLSYIYKILRVSTNIKFEVLIFFLNCSIVDLQYCVSIRDIAKRLMY